MLFVAEGEVFVWGEGDRGQLGLGDSTEKTATPTKVRLPSGTSSPTCVCCGSDCSIIITETGQMLASGVNKYSSWQILLFMTIMAATTCGCL